MCQMFVITFQRPVTDDSLLSRAKLQSIVMRKKAFFSGDARRDACLLVSSPRSFVIAVGAEAMAAVDNPLFAEDDFSAFAPEDGVQAPEPSGWHGEPTGPLQPPSPCSTPRSARS